MRLIDADALRIDFKNRVKACDKWIEECSGEQITRAIATKDFIFEVIMTIDNAPTEERPRGEWIEKCTSFGGKCWAKCSVCNEFANGFGRDNGFGHDYFYPNFCPNCGADMREGEAE